ncbi:hypothetical protein [Nocardioides sp. CFH 31398]|uniref:hypothetical protein n=1 Tax=Nocardioides sp. CFH 31398 TaxID=2919579 RepID=UPI001F063C5C|nr:hypothetical protein [Nocardioides sp. CFH 31398]MCH1866125.1 hypothetical protein [Nocardioides sp. CFH 31398]
MVLLVWVGSVAVGIAAGIALERRVMRRLAALADGTVRGGVLVGTSLMVLAAFVAAACATAAAGLASGGHAAAALTVACVGAVLGAALAEPLLPWISQSGWRFVRGIAADARAAGVPRPSAAGMARAGAVTGYVLVWPALIGTLAAILDLGGR